MYASWYSGTQRGQYGRSPYKARIDRVATVLLARRYQRAVVRQHLHEWLTFTEYLQDHDLALFRDIRDPGVPVYVRARPTATSASRIRFIYASIRILLEAGEDGSFARRVGGITPAFPAWCRDAFEAYLDDMRRHQGLSASTVRRRRLQLVLFAGALVRRGVTALAEATVADIQVASAAAADRAVLTRRSYASATRCFLRWAHQACLVSRDLSAAVMSIRLYRYRGVPDVLTSAETDQILKAVDRSSPVGRRDYAVLLLAARYGLRPGDIRRLCLDEIDWRGGVICLCQAKTGRTLVLPLLRDVAAALAAYLHDGRPTTERREVFIRHVAPFEPFVPANNLSTIMRTALRQAGLGERPGRRGLYLFRHTLATRLLEAGHPFKTVSDLLGHVCLDSTLGYAKVDLAHLRTVALSAKEVVR